MKPTLKSFSAGALVLAALEQVHAQYTPPPPPTPFQGFLNEYLRQGNPYMNQWDFGGQERLRFEDKRGFLHARQSRFAWISAQHGADEQQRTICCRASGFTPVTPTNGGAPTWKARAVSAASDDRFAYANVPAVAGTTKTHGNGPESDILTCIRLMSPSATTRNFRCRSRWAGRN